MHTRVACCLLFLTASVLMSAQVKGKISGVVVDGDGKPIAAAQVHIAETKPFYGHRILQFYETDKDGKFLIDHVPWGTYAVMGGKEEAGYPDTKGAFYSNLAVPIVILAPAFPSAEVIVPLGPKAGSLDILSVIDAVSGKKIAGGIITLRRLDNPTFLIKTSTTMLHPILIPALVDVAVEISAPGYKTWPSQDSAEGRVRLKSEENLKLEIKLQPEVVKPIPVKRY